MRVPSGVFTAITVAGGIALVTAMFLAVAGNGENSLGWVMLGPTPFYLACVFAFWRRPLHAAVRWLLVVGVLFGVQTATEYGVRVAVAEQAGNAHALLFVAQWAELATLTAAIAFFGTFPLGRPERRFERCVLAAAATAAVFLPVLLAASRPTRTASRFALADFPPLASPFHIPVLAPLGDGLAEVYHASPVFALIGPVLLALRYRRSAEEQRRQIRWLLLGGGFMVMATLPVLILDIGHGSGLDTLIWILAGSGLVASILIGLLRAGLLDVDRLIRQSLVYAALWLLIALGYVGAAAALGLAAAEAQLPIAAAVLLTIVATLVFQPARRWLERLADRRVFGERLSGHDLLSRFGQALEQTTQIDDLLPHVAQTIQRGLRLRWARVVLEGLPPCGEAGIVSGEPEVVVPLAEGGGRIECGPKIKGTFLAEDHQLLATLARQAAAAVHNLRLTAQLAIRAEELAASRARLAQAQDAERRRIQRDLHDGAQQEVVALATTLGLARSQLRRGDDRVAATLGELQNDILSLLHHLRDLAYSVRPPVLSDSGLLEAVEAHAARLPLPVAIEADPRLRGTRYPAQIEGAAWYAIAEALTNTVKHSAARRAVVCLDQQDGLLVADISDDGRGFDPTRVTGFGLTGLADRMAIVGGSLLVDSAPGRGTRVRLELPLPGG